MVDNASLFEPHRKHYELQMRFGGETAVEVGAGEAEVEETVASSYPLVAMRKHAMLQRCVACTKNFAGILSSSAADAPSGAAGHLRVLRLCNYCADLFSSRRVVVEDGAEGDERAAAGGGEDGGEGEGETALVAAGGGGGGKLSRTGWTGRTTTTPGAGTGSSTCTSRCENAGVVGVGDLRGGFWGTRVGLRVCFSQNANRAVILQQLWYFHAVLARGDFWSCSSCGFFGCEFLVWLGDTFGIVIFTPSMYFSAT